MSLPIKERHLRDLYVVGKVHTLSDGKTVVDPETNEEVELPAVTVYLKKLNSSDSEKAIRIANSARSRVLAASRDPESELYEATMNEVQESDRETLIDFLVSEPLMKFRQSTEAELAETPEWSDENYLQSLGDAWRDGLNDRFQEDPEDDEARRCFAEMKRFSDAVDELVEGHLEELRKEFEDVPRESLEKKALVQLLKNQADVEWAETYRNAQIYLATRFVDDTKKLYFDGVGDVKDLETATLLDLLVTYRSLTIDPTEGKGLEETPSS